MIDLSGAKVGDKFLLRGGQTAQVIVINETQVVMSNDEGFYLNARSNGKSVEFDEFDIISKIDTRPWLKDMPDAGIFEGEFLAFESADSGWYAYEKRPKLTASMFSTEGMFALTIISGINMPKLVGDQWKDSLISIDELREWQGVNK